MKTPSTRQYLLNLCLAIAWTTSIHAGQEKLLLWNSLGSESEVQNSVVGPDGVQTGGTFVTGISGGALLAENWEAMPVRFPIGGFPTQQGRYEFWARLVDPPFFVDSAGIFFGIVLSPSLDYAVGIGSNDGQGGGGFFGRAGIGEDGAEAATGNFGLYTYEGVLGAGKEEDWHHFEMVWNADGIPGVDDGNREVATYLDGVLDSGYWTSTDQFPEVGFFPSGAELALLLNYEGQGAVVIDEFKVYGVVPETGMGWGGVLIISMIAGREVKRRLASRRGLRTNPASSSTVS